MRIDSRISPRRNPGRRQIIEIATDLRLCRDPVLAHRSPTLFVPLFRIEEEELVLLDRSAYGEAVIVAAQEVLFSAKSGIDAAKFLLAEEKVCGIELIVAAEIVGVAVKRVPARFGDEVDLCAAGAAILRAVAVAQDFIYLDRVHRGIDKNGALRAQVIIVTPVHLPLVGIGRRAAEGDVNPRQQALVLIV